MAKLSADIASIAGEIAELQADLQTAPPGSKAGLATRIKALQRQLSRLETQGVACRQPAVPMAPPTTGAQQRPRQAPTYRPVLTTVVLCKTVTKTISRKGKRQKVRQQTCMSKPMFSTDPLTTTNARVLLSKGRVLYATGTASRARLVLHERKSLYAGVYTLTLTRQQGRLQVRTTQQIRIS